MNDKTVIKVLGAMLVFFTVSVGILIGLFFTSGKLKASPEAEIIEGLIKRETLFRKGHCEYGYYTYRDYHDVFRQVDYCHCEYSGQTCAVSN